MVGVYGLWPGVVAMTADADMYCVPCAKYLYDDHVIQAVIDGSSGYEQYCDNEGNPFGVVLRGSEDTHTRACGRCGDRLCEQGCPCYRYPVLWWRERRLVWEE